MIHGQMTPRFVDNTAKRHRSEKAWNVIFLVSTAIGIIALILLMLNIINQSFGYVALDTRVDPDELAINGVPIEEQAKEPLLATLQDRISAGRFRQLNRELPMEDRTRDDLYDLVWAEVVRPKIAETWLLYDSLFHKDQVMAEFQESVPKGELRFHSWLNGRILTRPQSSDPMLAGVRTAILGSLWTILITILFAFPLGVGAAIYLEEYAVDTKLNRIIQTNISNLAGVPSIIYGMLGLAIFVRTLEPLTSGAMVGLSDPATANGRTVLSAGWTLALLVLPLIIINAQEAIRSVSNALRQASYGLGATKWQTIWHHVLPSAIPGIMTGTILAISRAIGETAPLVVVGAATYITFDPSSPFSKFTTLPIQIYQWTSRPQPEFRNLAAGAILVLLIMLLSLNAIAIIMRNRYRKALYDR